MGKILIMSLIIALFLISGCAEKALEQEKETIEEHLNSENQK